MTVGVLRTHAQAGGGGGGEVQGEGNGAGLKEMLSTEETVLKYAKRLLYEMYDRRKDAKTRFRCLRYQNLAR